MSKESGCWAIALVVCVALPLEANPSVIAIESPAGWGSSQAHLVVTEQGDVVLNWLEVNGPLSVLKVATLEEDGWQNVREVARGRDWFVNWADFPSVVPLTADRWIAHWLVRHPDDRFAYDIRIAHSENGGETWSEPMVLHDDGTTSEHGFVSIVASQGMAEIVWLDGRDVARGTNQSSMTLRSARIDSRHSIGERRAIDERVCDCCPTSAVATERGTVVAYRDRTVDEIRDIAVVQRVDGAWRVPTRVADDGWHITGCPVNGPAIDAQDGEDGGAAQVVVAWPTGTGDDARVRFARSFDGGASFEGAIDVDTARPIGRVDVVLVDAGRAIVSWLRRDGDQGRLSIRVVERNGTMGPIHDIAAISDERPSGFPQMVRSGDALIFAWTEITRSTLQVRTARVSMASL